MHPLIKFAIFAHPRRQCVAVALINNYGIKCTENQWQGLIWGRNKGNPLRSLRRNGELETGHDDPNYI